MSGYRPRGVLSRAILDKFQNDAFLTDPEIIRSWYKMERELPAEYQDKFIDFAPDDQTLQWLQSSRQISSQLFLQLYFLVAKFFLSIFMTQTDLNGVLNRGSMFILSENQIVTMLKKSGFIMPKNGAVQVLDIGAGDGHCTARIQSALKQLDRGTLPHMMVTETSWIMRKRLAKYQNFSIVEVPDVATLQNLDLVACLNVLDRCADPHQMLRDIHNILSPSGRAIIALVLPYYHYVESNSTHLPLQPLLPHWPNNYSGAAGGSSIGSSCDCSEHHCGYSKRPSFEEEARIFFEVLQEKGFKVESFTRAPYLCEGDFRQSFYYLIDVVVVVSKVAVPEGAAPGQSIQRS